LSFYEGVGVLKIKESEVLKIEESEVEWELFCSNSTALLIFKLVTSEIGSRCATYYVMVLGSILCSIFWSYSFSVLKVSECSGSALLKWAFEK
jgi:hypothetical protein